MEASDLLWSSPSEVLSQDTLLLSTDEQASVAVNTRFSSNGDSGGSPAALDPPCATMSKPVASVNSVPTARARTQLLVNEAPASDSRSTFFECCRHGLVQSPWSEVWHFRCQTSQSPCFTSTRLCGNRFAHGPLFFSFRHSSRRHMRLFPLIAVFLLFSFTCLQSNSPCVTFSLLPAAGQIVSYTGFRAPGPLSATPQRGAFFLYEEGTRFYFPVFTSSGANTEKTTTVTFKNLVFTQDSSAAIEATLPSYDGANTPTENGGALSEELAKTSPVSPAGIEISLLPYEYTRTIFSTSSVAAFCCIPPAPPEPFMPTAACPYPGALRRPVHADTMGVNVRSTTSRQNSKPEGTINTQNSSSGGTSAIDAGAPRGNSGTVNNGNAVGTTTADGAVTSTASSDAAGGGLGGSSPTDSLVDFTGYSQPVLLRRGGADTHQVTLNVKEGGIYFLVISNCGGLAQLTFDGEVQVRNAYGYLPGHEYPKMPFYFIFMLVYVGVCCVWGFLLYRQRANLIAFHKCMLLVAVLGFLECLALFVYFSDFNFRGSRSSVLLVISVLVSVVKNIFSYMLVLLGAIGWSITIPVLERKTVVKMQIIVVLYIILDTARQVSDEFSHSHSLPLVLLLTCLFPISALNGLLFYWIISSINSNVEMLQQQKQHEKLLMYKRLYAVLLLAIFLAIIDLLCQIYVASWDASFPWKNQWWLSDAVPHFLFLLVLGAMMFIWRPNHQSKRLAYFTELGDADDLERAAVENRNKNAAALGGAAAYRRKVWGEELDFHDHFSEDELEAGIPNFQLHSVGSISDEGEYSDGEAGATADMHTEEPIKKELHEEGDELRSTSSRAPTAASSNVRQTRDPQPSAQPPQKVPVPGSSRTPQAGGPTVKGRSDGAAGRNIAPAESRELASDDSNNIKFSGDSTSRRGGGGLPSVSPREGAVELSAGVPPPYASGGTKKP